MQVDFPLQIDGVQLPAPSGHKYREADLVENSSRNAAGYATWDVVRYNVGSLDLTWKAIGRGEIMQIAAAIRSKKHFNVTFLNPYTGNVETRSFYSGDRESELLQYISTLDYWSSLTIPFVEV